MIRLSTNLAKAGLQPQLWHYRQQVATVCSVCHELLRQAQHQRLQKHPHLLQQLQLAQQRQPLQRKYTDERSATSDSTESWGYTGKHGVDDWSSMFESCRGSSQSPIDLHTSLATVDENLTPFTFTNFGTSEGITWSLGNNGHSAQVTYTSGDLRVSGGALKDEYSVEQFHFHWGDSDFLGSEHTVDGQPYPMEMHVVTYKSEYGNLSNALNFDDGLAVLGSFFEVADTNNADFMTLISALRKIKLPGTTYSLAPVPLNTLLPGDTDKYYRYHGSLTTPPCSEVVIWTVFREPVSISSDQLSQFRKLKSRQKNEAGKFLPLVNNFRPVQPLNGRIVRINF